MFKDNVRTHLEDIIEPREGACGICHAVAEEVCSHGGAIVAYERPNGILARILNDNGIISRLRIVGDNGNGLLMVDIELSARVFTPPAIL